MYNKKKEKEMKENEKLFLFTINNVVGFGVIFLRFGGIHNFFSHCALFVWKHFYFRI